MDPLFIVKTDSSKPTAFLEAIFKKIKYVGRP
jgi:hypothetical protein